MRKYTKPIFVSVLLLAITAVCVLITKTGHTGDSDDSANTRITTSFYPVYICALNITDGAQNVTVTNLTENLTGCPHEYQVTPDNLKTISKSNILLMNGLEMEEFLENYLSGYSDLKIADISALAEIDAKEEECEEEHDHEEEGHHHHVNGHVWTNPELYMRQIDAMAVFLSEQDSENAAVYLANAQSYKQRVSEAAEKLPKSLAGEKVIVFHDSLEYLCDYMGLDIVMTVEMDSDVPLSAGTVAQAVKTAKEQGVSMILCEKQFSDSAAASVAKEAGVDFVVLDSGVSGDANKDGYINMLAENAAAFEKIMKQEQE